MGDGSPPLLAFGTTSTAKELAARQLLDAVVEGDIQCAKSKLSPVPMINCALGTMQFLDCSAFGVLGAEWAGRLHDLGKGTEATTTAIVLVLLSYTFFSVFALFSGTIMY